MHLNYDKSRAEYLQSIEDKYNIVDEDCMIRLRRHNETKFRWRMPPDIEQTRQYRSSRVHDRRVDGFNAISETRAMEQILDEAQRIGEIAISSEDTTLLEDLEAPVVS
jgi:hypothetical protein